MSNSLKEFVQLVNEEMNHRNQRAVDSVSVEKSAEEQTILEVAAKMGYMTKDKSDLSAPDPLQPLGQKFVTMEQFNKHYNEFARRVQFQLGQIGGGGETWFARLDDVNGSTMNPSSDSYILEYDSSTKKVQFTNQVGPLDTLKFDLTRDGEVEKIPGTLYWNELDQTLDLEHPGGVTQQIGQESYAYVRNGTANTIINGTAVMFSGAMDSAGGARLLVSPMVSNGTFPSLYGLGIATQDLDPGQDGRVTVWGKVRGIDTSNWEVGDILYADPDNDGILTKVKPTSPNNVIPLAAVLKKDGLEGEIFVRPTIEQQKYYGRFSRTTDQTANTVNTPYQIGFDTTEISNGVIVNGPDNTMILVPDSGFYQFDFSAQVTAASNKGIVYFWIRKNGVDVNGSTRATTITNNDTFNITVNISLPLLQNDYIEIMWAKNASGIKMDALSPTSFAPAAVAVSLKVVQIQL